MSDHHSQSLPARGSRDDAETGSVRDSAPGKQQQPCSRKTMHGRQSVFTAKLKSTRTWRYDIALLCVVIVVVWVLLALPTIFYHLPQSSTDNRTDECIPENYTGSVCREALQSIQSCLPDGNASSSDIIIVMDPDSSQQDKEEKAKLLIGGLDQSPECMEAVVPFLCFYIFSLCDSSGRPYQPSSEECSAVTDRLSICARGIESDELPQCQLLPETTLECNVSQDLDVEGNTLLNTSTGRVCSEGFFISESTGLCVPECGVWEEFPHSFVVGFDAMVILSAIINLLSTTVVLVLSCISYKRMFSFPSIFIVYEVIAVGVVEVLLLIGYTDRTSLFCSSRDLFKSIENETPFCTIQGLAFYYATLMLILFWCFHIVLIFWKIRFPFHAKHFETKGYFRYICIIMVGTAIFLPLENLAASFGSGGFTITRFPPVMCYPKDVDAIFYSYILPISILFAIAVSLIATIFWFVTAKVGSRRKQPKSSFSLSQQSDGGDNQTLKTTVTATEVKVLIVFFYYFILGVHSLTFFTVISRDVTDFTSKLMTYFVCESQGVQPGRTCERDFSRMGTEIGMMFAYILLGFYPLVNLTYVVNFEDIKIFSKRLNQSRRYGIHTKSIKESTEMH